MKRSSQFFLHMGLSLSFIMIESILFYIGCSIRDGESVTIQVLPWASLTLFFLLCNELLSGKELPVNLLVTLNVIFCIISAVSGFFFIKAEPTTFLVHVFQILFPAATTLYGFYFTWYPEKIQSLLLAFDALVAFFLLFLFMDIVGILLPSNGLEIPYLTVTGIVLFLIIFLRIASNEERSKISWQSFIPVVLIIAGVLLLALIFALVISGQVKSITDLLVTILKTIALTALSIFGYISDILGKFFLWLINLLPEAEDAAVRMEQDAFTIPVGEPEEEIAMQIPIEVLIGVVAVVLILGLCFLFYHMRGVRVTKAKARKSPGKIQRSIELPFSFSGILKGAYERILYRIRLFQKRKTPAALAILVEEHERHHGRARQTQESAPAYLRRLSGHSDYQEKKAAAQALSELANLLQKEYYTNEEVQVSRRLYKAIRAEFQKP